MARQIPPFAVVAALGSLGCPAPEFQAFNTASEAVASSSTSADPSATTAEPVPTGGETPGVQTVTSDGDATTGPVPGDTSTSTTGPPPPRKLIEQFYFEPKTLAHAGAAKAVLVTTPAAESYALTCDDQPAGAGPIAAFVHEVEAETSADNGEHTCEVTVFGQGAAETADAKLTITLPPPGTPRCAFTEDEEGLSQITGLARTGETLVAVGTVGAPAGPRLALWKLDMTTCEEALGWPQLVLHWTALPGLGLKNSEGTGVAADALGNVAVAGLVGDGQTRQPYVALLDPAGEPLWEHLGDPGDEVRGVAIAPPPHELVVAVGARRTGVNPTRFDAMIWHHFSADVVAADQLKSPFIPGEDADVPNDQSERAFAVIVDPETTAVFVTGERELKKNDIISPRGFVARYDLLGGFLGAWTSTGDYLPHDGARAITLCEDGPRLGGWARNGNGSEPQPLTRWLDSQGASLQRRPEGYANTQTFGLACDRIGRTVHAATRDAGALTPRAELFAFPDAAAPLSWTANGGDGTTDAAFAVVCDEWGFCAWGGFQQMGQPPLPRAIVRVLHP